MAILMNDWERLQATTCPWRRLASTSDGRRRFEVGSGRRVGLPNGGMDSPSLPRQRVTKSDDDDDVSKGEIGSSEKEEPTVKDGERTSLVLFLISPHPLLPASEFSQLAKAFRGSRTGQGRRIDWSR